MLKNITNSLDERVLRILQYEIYRKLVKTGSYQSRELTNNVRRNKRIDSLTFNTLPFSEILSPGFFSKGRPSFNHVRVGAGIASLWHSSSTAWPRRAETFCSSPTILGGTKWKMGVSLGIKQASPPLAIMNHQDTYILDNSTFSFSRCRLTSILTYPLCIIRFRIKSVKKNHDEHAAVEQK